MSGGQLNQQIQAAPPAVQPGVRPSPVPDIVRQGAARLTGGGQERVAVKAIRFTGNSVVSSAELTAILPRLKPEGLDFDDLNALAEQVTQHYRDKGFPFARAFFAAQESQDGTLVLTIVEGRFGRVTVRNSSVLHDGIARAVVLNNLCPRGGPGCEGALITDTGLQRAALLLSDLPGVGVTSTFKRGEAFGTSDLDVTVTPDRRFTVQAGADNFGSPATGDYRGSAALSANELLGIGDRLDVNLAGSGEGLWNAAAEYSALVTPSGLRAGISGAHTHYLLGDSFAPLDANGIADTVGAFLSYPLVRQVPMNVNLGLAYQHKSLHDNIGLTGVRARSKIDNVLLSADGRWTDSLLGGGTGRFSLSYGHGVLSGLDAASLTLDQDPVTGLFTKGAFNKIAYAVERQQSLVGGLTAYTAVRGQYGDRNLSSAERFYLGGPTGVRAYGVGEGNGDSGAIATLELRHTQAIAGLGSLLSDSLFTVGAFFDGGWIRHNQNPIAGAGGNEANYGGAGLRAGLEKPGAYSINLSWSHSVGSRAALIDPGRKDQVWFQTAFQF